MDSKALIKQNKEIVKEKRLCLMCSKMEMKIMKDIPDEYDKNLLWLKCNSCKVIMGGNKRETPYYVDDLLKS